MSTRAEPPYAPGRQWICRFFETCLLSASKPRKSLGQTKNSAPNYQPRERVWGELRRLIPKHDRYYLQTDYGLIHFWTFTSLLPRIAVDDVRDADWVISYRTDPHALGVRFSSVRTIRHVYVSGSYSMLLAKVAR